VTLTATVSAALLLPFGGMSAPVHFAGDLVLFAYLLALGRFFTAAAALDTGSAFEGMGAAREVTFACLAEPAMFLGLLALVKLSGSLELSGMLAPEIRETLLGRAQVRQLFPITKVGTIYGSSVTEGKMVRGARVRIKRGETVLGESTITSLKRFKDDVREVLQGLECGSGIEGIRGVGPNDVIEAFTTEEVARTL
jgi:hypothetical protein